MHLLVEEIRAAITAQTTQVILTTHSPYLLDLLDLSHIIVTERVNGEPTFVRPNENALQESAKSFSQVALFHGATHPRQCMIQVGMLVECGRDGLEVHVCRRLCQLLGEHFGMPLH